MGICSEGELTLDLANDHAMAICSLEFLTDNLRTDEVTRVMTIFGVDLAPGFPNKPDAKKVGEDTKLVLTANVQSIAVPTVTIG